jgi:hypothetical protein
LNEGLLNKIKSAGLSYQQYYDLTKSEVETANPKQLDEDQKKRYEDKKLNLHRMTRIEKHYSVSDELKHLVLQIDKPQTWMIISETWCGDSAQNIPFIAKIAAVDPRIELKIVMRDSNPDVMDLYLTNGTRSIPILVAFDESGEELFRWGPRPDEAIKLFEDLKTAGIEKAVRLEKLHLWYGRNRGKNLESEFIAALKLSVTNT